MSFTVSEMEAAVRSRLNEPTEALITSAEILRALNEGYKDVSHLAGCIENSDVVSTVSGDRFVPYSGHKVNNVQYTELGGQLLILNYNGADGAETWDEEAQGLIDEYLPEHDNTAFVLDTSKKKFGTASLLAEGAATGLSFSSQYILPTAVTGDLTVHGWVRITGLATYEANGGSNNAAIGCIWIDNTIGSAEADLYITRSTVVPPTRFRNYIVDRAGTEISYAYITSPLLEDTDHHIALIVSGRNIMYAIDGTIQNTWTADIDNPLAGVNRFTIFTDYRLPVGTEVRYDAFEMVNYAKWMANFTPPPAAPSLRIASAVGLLKVRPETIGHIALEDTVPQHWSHWGDNVLIEPVPDDAYSLKLFVSDYPSAVLEDDTDTPTDLPDEFHLCVADFALWVLSLKLKKWNQAANYYNIYIRNLKKRKKEYIMRKAEKRKIHQIPDNVKGGREQPEKRNLHRIPDNVVRRQLWAR